MKGTFPIEKFGALQTPFYYYDATLLRNTLKTIQEEAGKYNKWSNYAGDLCDCYNYEIHVAAYIVYRRSKICRCI